DAGKAYRVAEITMLAEMLARRVAAWFGDVDLWVTPTVPVLPPAIGAWRDLDPAATFDAASKLGPFTAPFNVAGQPAASVPAGLTDAGVPMGVQLAGRRGDDGLVLAVARQLEQALPWRDRRPPRFV